MFEICVYIHLHGPGAGADNSLGSFLCNHKVSVTLIICCD